MGNSDNHNYAGSVLTGFPDKTTQVANWLTETGHYDLKGTIHGEKMLHIMSPCER